MKKQLICALSILMAGVLLTACTGNGNNQQGNNGGSENPNSQTQTIEVSDSAYTILVVDENDNPVPGVTVQFCDDTTCNLGTTESNGMAIFEPAAPGKFTVHMLDVPEGYEEDETEYVTEDTFGLLKVVLKGGAARENNANNTNPGNNTDKAILNETGVMVVLPENMKKLYGTLSWVDFSEKEGESIARLDYFGRTRDEINEFNKRYSEATENSDDEELINDFNAYMDEFFNTIDTALFYIYATKNGESIDEILSESPEELAPLKDYIKDTCDLGEKDGSRYYLLEVDQDKLLNLIYGEIPASEKAVEDDLTVIESIDMNEFAKGITLMGDQQIISFEGTNFDGSAVNSNDLFDGYTLTLVNLWGTWCYWCVEELPDLEEYNKELEKQGCHIIGICQDGVTKNDEAKQLLEDTGVTYTNVYLDDFYAVFPNVSSYPTTFIVNSDGVVVGLTEGANFNDYKTAVEEALKKVE